MKEQLHTIPINDAMEHAGECPFCYMERITEEHAMDFVLGHGASYMEADIREMTDQEGFCRLHFKKMYDYGNSLGNAWILKTLTSRHITEMQKVVKDFTPSSNKKRLFGSTSSTGNAIVDWISKREESCFICTMVQNTFQAYMKTFFDLYRKEAEFRQKVASSQGFCISHFKLLCQKADESLSDKDLSEFYQQILPLMEQNMNRIYEDISWFVEKYDYKNKDADWKNSKDAIQRGMQKLRGSDPSCAPYKIKK